MSNLRVRATRGLVAYFLVVLSPFSRTAFLICTSVQTKPTRKINQLHAARERARLRYLLTDSVEEISANPEEQNGMRVENLESSYHTQDMQR